jgi:hypothetical protein
VIFSTKSWCNTWFGIAGAFIPSSCAYSYIASVSFDSCPIAYGLTENLAIMSMLSQKKRCRAFMIELGAIKMLVQMCVTLEPIRGASDGTSVPSAGATAAMRHVAAVIGNLALEKDSIPHMVSQGVVRVLIKLCNTFAESKSKSDCGLKEAASLAIVNIAQALNEASPENEASRQVTLTLPRLNHKSQQQFVRYLFRKV